MTPVVNRKQKKPVNRPPDLPKRVYPFPVVLAWLKHMDKQALRHMPLVLDGEPNTNKTLSANTFAVDPKNYIELNCCNHVHERIYEV